MNKRKACKEIIDLFIRIVNKYNALEKYPARFGTKHDLYHSERHMIDKIGGHPGTNVTEFAKAAGVTKGAVSQIIKKLEKKGIIRRLRKIGNDKEILIELTRTGREVYQQHQKINEESALALLEELDKHSDDKIDFLISMFRWIEVYLDVSRRQMEGHAGRGH